LKKMAHTKLVEAKLKAIQASVKAQLDVKQVKKAVMALKKFSTSQKKKKDSLLLEDEDDSIHVTFTMNKVPTKPSPKPHMIELPAPYNA
jgi:hypothetical protein